MYTIVTNDAAAAAAPVLPAPRSSIASSAADASAGGASFSAAGESYIGLEIFTTSCSTIIVFCIAANGSASASMLLQHHEYNEVRSGTRHRLLRQIYYVLSRQLQEKQRQQQQWGACAGGQGDWERAFGASAAA